MQRENSKLHKECLIVLSSPSRQPGVRFLMGLGMLCLALAVPAMGRPPADKEDKVLLPKEVREALDRAASIYQQPLSGVQWSKVSILDPTDHPLYRVQGKNDRNNKVEVEVTGAGRVIEVEEHGIPLGEVPAAVLETVKEKRPDFKPTRAEAIYQNNRAQPVSYGLEGKDADGKTIEVYVSADGKTLLN